MSYFNEILNQSLTKLKNRDFESFYKLYAEYSESIESLYSLLKPIETKANSKLELINGTIFLTIEITGAIIIVILKKSDIDDMKNEIKILDSYKKYESIGMMSSFSVMEFLEIAEKFVIGIYFDDKSASGYVLVDKT